ncbi:MAG: MarC family protein [Firmicutes bacterium]|nr:MarC family protein [Bacillota bacterium]
MDWGLALNFFGALLAVLNPFGNVAHFLNYSAGDTPGVRKALAGLVSVAVLVIMIVCFFLGNKLLGFLGITIPAFQIGGGILLLLNGLGMIQGTKSSRAKTMHSQVGMNDYETAKLKMREIVVPLAMPIIAGPGTISTIILYASGAHLGMTYFSYLGVIVVIAVILFITLYCAQWIQDTIGEDGLQIAIRVLGLMLVAVGVQFILNGLAASTVGFINPAVVPQMKK